MKTPFVKAQFVKSAIWPKDYPPARLPEVAFVGRSNAGKSSLINGLLGEPLAKVSGQPGKTRLINFFEVNPSCGAQSRGSPSYGLIDLPGYGFAKVSQSEREKWRKMIETYFSLRGTLMGLVLVMDIRRKWSEDEGQIVKWVETTGKKGLVVLNKSDKLKTMARRESQSRVKEQVHWPVLLCSSVPSKVRSKAPSKELGKELGVTEVKKQLWKWVEP